MDKKFALTNHVWNRAFLVCPTFLDLENIWTITNTRRIRVANLHLWPKCDLCKYWIVRTTHKCCGVFESYIRFCRSGSEFYSAPDRSLHSDVTVTLVSIECIDRPVTGPQHKHEPRQYTAPALYLLQILLN